MQKRRKRFPLLSLLFLFALGFFLFHICDADQSVPQRAVTQLQSACGQIIGSFRMLVGADSTGTTGTIGTTGIFTASAESEFSFVETPLAPDMPLLVSDASPLPIGFVPQNLVRMRVYCDENIVYVKGSEIDGEKEAVDALMAMLRAAHADGVKNWQVNAGYRSVSYQQKLFDDRVYAFRKEGYSAEQANQAAAKYVAKPRSSEHHTGLAFDMTVPGESFGSTVQSQWLKAHCHEYGFIIRYTEEKAHITGFKAEPWHIRYVGQPHARIIYENGWCLEEYLGVATDNTPGAPGVLGDR